MGGLTETLKTNYTEMRSAGFKRRERLSNDLQRNDIRYFFYYLPKMPSHYLGPLVNSSAINYKTKLTCHNFTIYDLTSKNITC